MRILTRYVLRAHLGPFFFSLSVLTGLLLINTVARRFEELAGKGLPASVIAEVFALSIPYTLALTLPMSVLVAVLYVFSQLTADNEITALKASGVSLARLLAPLLCLSVLLAGGMVWFNNSVLPDANHQLKNLLMDVNRKSPTVTLREQVINPVPPNNPRFYLQAAKIEPVTNRLVDVVIYDVSNTSRDRTVYADSGYMAFNADQTDLFLTLYDGWIHERDMHEPDRFNRMFYDEQVIRMAGVGNVLERDSANAFRGDRELSAAMLKEQVRERRDELSEIEAQAREYTVGAVERSLSGPWAPSTAPSDVGHAVDLPVPANPDTPGRAPTERGVNGRALPPPSSGGASFDPDAEAPGGRDLLASQMASELRSLQSRAEALQKGINRYRVELHKKYAIPFACIIFVLIGAPLAVRFPRGGVGMVIAFSLLIFSIYWMGLTGGEQLGDRGYISPVPAMWTVNTVFLALGLWAMARIGREASTARGGGWDDLVYTLRGVFGRRRAATRRSDKGA